MKDKVGKFDHKVKIRKSLRPLIIMCLLSLVTCSCMKPSGSELARWIMGHCELDQICELALTEITPFDWTDVYFMREGMSLNEINSALGTEYVYFDDIAERIIFLNNGIVIHYEHRFSYPDRHPKVVLEIPIASDSSYSSFVSSSRFRIHRQSIGTVEYINIIPM